MSEYMCMYVHVCMMCTCECAMEPLSTDVKNVNFVASPYRNQFRHSSIKLEMQVLEDSTLPHSSTLSISECLSILREYISLIFTGISFTKAKLQK